MTLYRVPFMLSGYAYIEADEPEQAGEYAYAELTNLTPTAPVQAITTSAAVIDPVRIHEANPDVILSLEVARGAQ